MPSEYLELRSARESLRAGLAQVKESPFWSKHSDPELKIHRIHAYPAKFPAFITSKALAFAKSKGVRVKTIGDVFCGCGTVAFEARRNGIDFWGCDINPVATLIAIEARPAASAARNLERPSARSMTYFSAPPIAGAKPWV